MISTRFHIALILAVLLYFAAERKEYLLGYIAQMKNITGLNY